MSEVTRMGILGVGNMGSAHANTILSGKIPGMSLTGLCDENPEKLKAFADKEGVKTFSKAEDMINSGEADAILIATPHYGHTTYGIQALEKGLHVLVEKPISVHKADCEKLIAAHTDEKQVFAAMFNQRTNPQYQKLRQMIQDGELGELRRLQWTITDWFRTEYYYKSGGWRATWAGEGGGVLLNQCPHQLDLWQWLFGMPRKVRTHLSLGRFHDIEVEDDVTTYMEYENGCTGVFITTTGEAPGTNRLEVVGERGKIVIEKDIFTFIRNEVPTSEHSASIQTGFTKPSVWNIDIPSGGGGEQHAGILTNFAKAVNDGEDLVARAEEGIHSVELANAMILSGIKETTVELPLDAAEYEALLKEKIESSTFVKETVDTSGGADDFSSSF